MNSSIKRTTGLYRMLNGHLPDMKRIIRTGPGCSPAKTCTERICTGDVVMMSGLIHRHSKNTHTHGHTRLNMRTETRAPLFIPPLSFGPCPVLVLCILVYHRCLPGNPLVSLLILYSADSHGLSAGQYCPYV